jgi:hypothetical protein
MTTKGDIEYDSAAATAARLAIGTTGQVLTVAAGIPSWATPSVVSVNSHYQSTQTTSPTTTTSANAGSGATSSVSNATDVAGHLTLTLGSVGTLSSGIQTTINFNAAYTVAPIVTITPSNATAANNVALFGVFVTSTTAGWSLNFATAGVALDVLTFNYHVIQTQ